MPHEIPITKTELDEPPSTIYDYPDSSNREPSMPPNDDDLYFSRCRWYGEDFFKFSLKMAIFKNASKHATADDLKLEQTQAEIDFPYLNCIEKLDAIKAIKVPESTKSGQIQPYTTFITKLGAIAGGVDYGTTNKLGLLIRTQGSFPTVGANPDETVLSSSPGPGDYSLDGDKTIALCSSKLHEWATKEHKSISYRAKQISIEPPLNEVVVLVDGFEFTAAAKKQNMAKHIACKQACERFEIMT